MPNNVIDTSHVQSVLIEFYFIYTEKLQFVHRGVNALTKKQTLNRLKTWVTVQLKKTLVLFDCICKSQVKQTKLKNQKVDYSTGHSG